MNRTVRVNVRNEPPGPAGLFWGFCLIALGLTVYSLGRPAAAVVGAAAEELIAPASAGPAVALETEDCFGDCADFTPKTRAVARCGGFRVVVYDGWGGVYPGLDPMPSARQIEAVAAVGGVRRAIRFHESVAFEHDRPATAAMARKICRALGFGGEPEGEPAP